MDYRTTSKQSSNNLISFFQWGCCVFLFRNASLVTHSYRPTILMYSLFCLLPLVLLLTIELLRPLNTQLIVSARYLVANSKM
ncbi:hypothetical protein BDZ91DRAFT_715846 [Kalaharituber pfeilii]|nr:hypothetical protein BDZ91DRAFT_715846 [Kalaharituber pfeilii]